MPCDLRIHVLTIDISDYRERWSNGIQELWIDSQNCLKVKHNPSEMSVRSLGFDKK